MRYIVDNYHYKSYPVDPSLLYNFKYKYYGVELNTPFFQAVLTLQNDRDYQFTANYKSTAYIIHDNRTEIIGSSTSYSRLNPDDDIYLVDYSEYCYSDCYYYEIIKSLTKEQVLKLFEDSYRNNFTNKLSNYLNKTFDDNSGTPNPYNNIKSRNLDNTNEFYYEYSWFADNYIKYVGLFTNEEQLVLFIREEKEYMYTSSQFQMKYVIDSFNKESIIAIIVIIN